MRTFLIILLASCTISVLAENFAVTFYSGDTTGIPDGYLKTLRPLGEATGPLAAGEQLRSKDEVEAVRASFAAVMDDRKARLIARDAAARIVPAELRRRVLESDFSELKIDALQSEFVGILLKAYLQNTELLLLVTKAVAPSALTNNLTAQERARVVALRPQLAFPQQPDLTSADRARAVAIRDNVLIPHYQLYQAAKALLDAARTNANPPDVSSPVSWPSTSIGD